MLTQQELLAQVAEGHQTFWLAIGSETKGFNLADVKFLPETQLIFQLEDRNVRLPDLSTLPASVVEVTIENGSFCADTVFANTVLTLSFEGCSGVETLTLPDKLEHLGISECPELKKLPDLPSSLVSLFIEDCGLVELPLMLPAGLRSLSIQESDISTVRNLESCPITRMVLKGGLLHKELPKLPGTLESLTVEDWPELLTLPVLPQALGALWVAGCPKLLALPALPETLYILSVDNSGLKELPSLPAGIRSLRFANLPSLAHVPLSGIFPDLERIIICRCPGINPPSPISVLFSGTVVAEEIDAVRALPGYEAVADQLPNLAFFCSVPES